MAAIDLFVGERVALLFPAEAGRAEIDSIGAAFDLALFRGVEQMQLVRRELVAGQGIRPRMKDGPAAAARRSLDEVDLFSFARLNSKTDESLRIGRPLQHVVSQS